MHDPVPLSQALSEYIARRGLARTQAPSQMAAIWSKVAGERLARDTKVIGLRRGVLEISVSSSALLSELAAFHQMDLLKKFRVEYPQQEIRDLRFRLRNETDRS